MRLMGRLYESFIALAQPHTGMSVPVKRRSTHRSPPASPVARTPPAFTGVGGGLSSFAKSNGLRRVVGEAKLLGLRPTVWGCCMAWRGRKVARLIPRGCPVGRARTSPTCIIRALKFQVLYTFDFGGLASFSASSRRVGVGVCVCMGAGRQWCLHPVALGEGYGEGIFFNSTFQHGERSCTVHCRRLRSLCSAGFNLGHLSQV